MEQSATRKPPTTIITTATTGPGQGNDAKQQTQYSLPPDLAQMLATLATTAQRTQQAKTAQNGMSPTQQPTQQQGMSQPVQPSPAQGGGAPGSNQMGLPSDIMQMLTQVTQQNMAMSGGVTSSSAIMALPANVRNLLGAVTVCKLVYASGQNRL